MRDLEALKTLSNFNNKTRPLFQDQIEIQLPLTKFKCLKEIRFFNKGSRYASVTYFPVLLLRAEIIPK